MSHALCVLLALSSVGAQESAQDTLAIVHARVLPMERGGASLLQDHAVLIRDGRIESLAPTSELELPAGCRIIDAEGRFLIPGLVDMHVHVTDEGELLLNVAAGVTSVRNLWGLPMHLAMQKRIEAGSLLGPTLYTTGPITDGVPPLWEGSVGIDDPGQARDEVARQKAAGFEALKVYSALQEDVYIALVDAAREQDMRVTGHVPDAVGIRTALAIGQDCIEHLEGYFPFGASAPVGDTAELVELTVEAGTWNCVTLIVMANIAQLGDPVPLQERPAMRWVSPRTRASWDPEFDWRFKNVPPSGFERLQATVRSMQAFTLALHAGGARIVVGTDTPNPYVVPGFAVHDELALLVEAGLEPYDALHAATAAPAQYLGRSEEFGRIAPGLRADLLLLDGNPLEDIAHTRQRAGVVLRGRWLSESELEERLEALAVSYAADALALQKDALELPDEGEPWIAGRYERRHNGVVSGVERVAVRRIAGERLVVHARALDTEGREAHLRQELDQGLLDAAFAYAQRLGGEEIRIAGRKDGERMAITAEPDNTALPTKLDADGRALMHLPGCGSLQVLALRLQGLDPGDELRFEELELDPESGVTERGYVAIALSPAPGEEVRSYRIESRSDARLIELTTDAQGRLLEARIQLQIGRLAFVLLE